MGVDHIHTFSVSKLLFATIAFVAIHGARIDIPEANPNEYIVMFHGKSSKAQPKALHGLNLKSSARLGNRYMAVVEADQEMIQRLSEDPDVDIVEQNNIAYHERFMDFKDHGDFIEPVRTNSYNGPSDSVCHKHYVGRDGWGIVRTSHRSLPDFDADPYIYGEYDSGQGVDIYVIDSGLFHKHDDFEGRAFHGFTGELIPDGDDDLGGHGTHVAGTAGGRRFGIARKSTLIGVKVLNGDGWGYWSDIAAGVGYAIDRHHNKAKETGNPSRSVLNLSLGGGRNSYSYTLETVLQMAADEGLHVVVAAGNDYDDTCYFSPARSSVSFSVGATNINDSMAVFTNFGPCTNILAPGRTIMGPFILGTKRYVSMSGTSMASPHVAGIIARYISQLSDDEVVHATPSAIRAKLTDEATRTMIDLDGAVPGEVATPNRLLFKDCYYPTVTTTVQPTTAGNDTAYTTSSDTTMPVESVDLEDALQKVGPLVVATMSVSAVMAGFNFLTLAMICCAWRK